MQKLINYLQLKVKLDQTTKSGSLMRKILFPIQKLAMVFFYLQLMLGFDKLSYATLSILLMILSIKFEGARPYTPLLFIIILLEMFQFSILQAIFVILAGIAGVLFKIYDINLPIKGPYQMGHRYKNIQYNKQNLLVSIFYPTLSKGQRTQWIPKKDYNKVLYEIFHVDPCTRRIPYRIFEFIVSYIHKIYLPAQHNSPYLNENQNAILGESPEHKQNKRKVIIFSHGLGSHLNAYSSIFANWVGQGYNVISINHDHDQVCVDHRKVSETDPYLIRDFLFLKRNRDLKIRINQIATLVDAISEPNFFKQALGVDIQVKQIILGGHSFGGGTAVATKAFLNKRKSEKQKNIKISKIICLDPWFFPFDPEMFEELNDQNILIINSHYFYQQVPYIYVLQKKFVKLKQRNPNIKAYMVTGMDHIAQCDMAYVFGNILQFTGSIKLYNLTDRFMGLNILMCHLFLQDKSKQEILKIANKFVVEKKMDFHRVEVKEQYRITRQLTFGKDVPENQQQFYDKI